jgi:hypothetical protein
MTSVTGYPQFCLQEENEEEDEEMNKKSILQEKLISLSTPSLHFSFSRNVSLSVSISVI